MKSIIFGVTATVLALSLGACAQKSDKIVLAGEPVVLERNGNTYVAPSNLTMTSEGYYYVNVNNRTRVCYVSEQPTLTNLNFLVLNVSIGGNTQRLVCYTASPDYFVINR